MVPVTVTVDVRGRTVPVDQVTDRRIADALRAMGRQVGERLISVSCPTHRKGPTHVRIHMAQSGEADITYESCCELLRTRVGKALG